MIIPGMPFGILRGGGDFVAVASADEYALNLHAFAVAQGWDESAPLLFMIEDDVVISGIGTGTGNHALTVDGEYPGGLIIVNNGYIIGRGGSGGNGGSASSTGTPSTGVPQAGGAGGRALLLSSPCEIENAGVIAGGGGGGGGGGGAAAHWGSASQLRSAGGGGGGGGGQTALTNTGPGSGGGATASGGGTDNKRQNGFAGAWGTYSNPGTHGNGGSATATDGTRHLTSSGGRGGAGGDWGQAGGNGLNGSVNLSGGSNPSTSTRNGASGGPAGPAIIGYSNATWISEGDVRGPTSG